jgi:hypothetical protein
MPRCPDCGSDGTISVWPVLVAKPLGTFSLAGAQMKVSAVQAAVARCSACEFTVNGHPEGDTYSPDGKAFTGGYFVADPPS